MQKVEPKAFCRKYYALDTRAKVVSGMAENTKRAVSKVCQSFIILKLHLAQLETSAFKLIFAINIPIAIQKRWY